MTFIANPPPSSATSKITNDGWFPDVAPSDFQKVMRLDGTVSEERIQHALIDATVQTNDELASYKAGKLAAGINSLATVPATKINDASVLLHHYTRAIYCFAKANLIERYRDLDSTRAGNARAEELESPIDDYRRDARLAIRAILGIGATTVELL